MEKVMEHFFAGFLALSSLPALIRQIGKLAKDYPTREKLKNVFR